MELTITINDASVRAMLNGTPAQINRALVAGLNDASALLLGDLKEYPEQHSNSTYRRTRDLAKSWTRDLGTAKLQARVGSNPNVAPYNVWVQNEPTQARVHRGRWGNTIQAVTRNRQQQINDMFASRLRQFVG
jgi:hypothetical protein